jgi:flagellar motor switch protein FliM
MAEFPAGILLHSRSKNTEDSVPAVEEYLRAVGTRLRARLVNRTSSNFVVQLSAVEVRPLGSIRQDPDFSTQATYGLIRMDKVRAPGGFAVQRQLLTRIIGAMLGDDAGEAPPEPEEGGEARGLSPVESRIAARLMADLCVDVVRAWPEGGAPEVTLEAGPGQPRVIDSVSAEEEVFIGVFSLGPDDDAYGKIAVALPTQVVRGVGKPVADGANKAKPRVPRMSQVMPIEVDVVAEMARLPMRVRDLHLLRVGDLVPLGPVDGALIRINGRALFQGEPGHANGQRSIRVRRKADR